MSIAAFPERRPLAWLLLLSAAAFFVYAMLDAAQGAPGFDLVPMSVAGRLVATGQTAHLYSQDPLNYNMSGDPVVTQAAHDVGFPLDPTPFVYPPLVAALMAPLASVPFPIVFRAWTIASIVLAFATIYLVLRLYLPVWNTPHHWAVLLLALSIFEPLRYSFWLGQSTAIVLPLILAAIALQRRGHAFAAGLALGLPAFVKVTPIVIGAIWLWRGPRRAFAALVVSLGLLWTASFVVGGAPVNQAYFDRVRAIGRVTLVSYNNHSLIAFLSRPFTPPRQWYRWEMSATDPVLLVFVTGALAVWLLVTWLFVSRVPDDRQDAWRPCAEAAALLAMLLAPSIVWTHYFVFLLPVCAVLLAQPSRGVSLNVAVAAAFLLCCRPLLARQDLPPPASVALLLGGPTVAALILAVAILNVAHGLARGTELEN